MRNSKALPLLALAAALAAPAGAGWNDDDLQRGMEFPKTQTAAPKPVERDADKGLEDLADHQLQMLSDALKLDEGQKKKIRPILLKKMKKLEELQKEQHSVEQKSDESVRETLTDDQKEQFDALRVQSRTHAAPKQ